MLPDKKTVLVYFALRRTRWYKICKSTEGFLSKPGQSTFAKYKVSQKPRSILKSAQESQPVIDCARLRMWIRQQQRKRWKILQRLSGDSTEMKQRLLRLLIVSLRERGSAFISRSGFPLTSSDCLWCVFQTMSCQTAKQLEVFIMSCRVIAHVKMDEWSFFFFCQSVTWNISRSLFWFHFNVNISIISHNLTPFNDLCHQVPRVQNVIISTVRHSWVGQ